MNNVNGRSSESRLSHLVGGLEHFLFSHILGIIIPIDFHIFQRGSNHQPVMDRHDKQAHTHTHTGSQNINRSHYQSPAWLLENSPLYRWIFPISPPPLTPERGSAITACEKAFQWTWALQLLQRSHGRDDELCLVELGCFNWRWMGFPHGIS